MKARKEHRCKEGGVHILHILTPRIGLGFVQQPRDSLQTSNHRSVRRLFDFSSLYSVHVCTLHVSKITAGGRPLPLELSLNILEDVALLPRYTNLL